MTVTLYRQVGKGKSDATKRSIWAKDGDQPISPVPTFFVIREGQ